MPNELKSPQYYTLVVIPNDTYGKTYSLKIPKFAVKTAIISLIAIIVVVSGSVIYSSWLTRRMVNYYQTMAKNKEQHLIIKGFSQQSTKVQKQISELIEQDNALRKTLGLKSWRSKVKLYDRLDGRSNSTFNWQQANQLAEKSQSLEELKGWVNKIQKRLAFPSKAAACRLMSGLLSVSWRDAHRH